VLVCFIYVNCGDKFFSVIAKWDLLTKSKTRSGASLLHLVRKLPACDEDIDFAIAGGGASDSDGSRPASPAASSDAGSVHSAAAVSVASIPSSASSSEDEAAAPPGDLLGYHYLV